MAGTVTCNMASLANGASAELTITVAAPDSFGNITNTASPPRSGDALLGVGEFGCVPTARMATLESVH